MVNKQSRSEVRVKKHNRMRNRFAGTAERPRLAVFRSNNHMYAQIIDDTVGNTLVAASTVEKEIKAELEKTNDKAAAAYVGTVIAKRALEKGIKEVVFDRGGFIYHGTSTFNSLGYSLDCHYSIIQLQLTGINNCCLLYTSGWDGLHHEPEFSIVKIFPPIEL